MLPEKWYYPLENTSDVVFDRVRKYLQKKNAIHLSLLSKNCILLSKHLCDGSCYWSGSTNWFERVLENSPYKNYVKLTETQFLKELGYIPVNELVKDEYYYCSLEGENKDYIVFQFEKRGNRPLWIEGKTLKNANIIDNDISNTRWSDYIRVATQEEIQLFKQKTNTMEKEIIGYKLSKPEYEKVAVAICKAQGSTEIDNFKLHNDGLSFKCNSFAKTWLKNAGVLNLWFTAVYEEEAQIFPMGFFTVKVKNNQAYHITDNDEEENITDFVKELCEHYSVKRFGKFNVVPVIKFESTGCRNHPTTLEEWQKVYNALK